MHWTTPGYESLELSTQLVIREALRRGHTVDVLDPTASFIRVRGRGRVEYIRQATRTSADADVSVLIMENKRVTKTLLAEAGVRVPQGQAYGDLAGALHDYGGWAARGVVIKPNSTNFGIGVSLLAPRVAEADYVRAAEAALEADDVILAEELLSGQELRFLVIGQAVRAVLHRVPAHVVGDGQSTIAALIRKKNLDPRRGKGYLSPLEKIAMGAEEELFLAAQGLTFDSVPAAGTTVSLRKNSNISTGGDSIDFTDDVHPGYRDLAVASAAVVGARICGVDMMIHDVQSAPTADNYGVIELNFNPALHIHDFPSKGRNRHVERAVLDLLEL
jgi:glutamate--cysteine ligase